MGAVAAAAAVQQIAGSLVVNAFALTAAYAIQRANAPDQQEDPSLGSLEGNLADEGSPGHRSFGPLNRIAGAYLYIGLPRPVRQQSTSKRGAVTHYDWFVDAFIALSYNRIEDVTRIDFDSQTVYISESSGQQVSSIVATQTPPFSSVTSFGDVFWDPVNSTQTWGLREFLVTIAPNPNPVPTFTYWWPETVSITYASDPLQTTQAQFASFIPGELLQVQRDVPSTTVPNTQIPVSPGGPASDPGLILASYRQQVAGGVRQVVTVETFPNLGNDEETANIFRYSNGSLGAPAITTNHETPPEIVDDQINYVRQAYETFPFQTSFTPGTPISYNWGLTATFPAPTPFLRNVFPFGAKREWSALDYWIFNQLDTQFNKGWLGRPVDPDSSQIRLGQPDGATNKSTQWALNAPDEVPGLPGIAGMFLKDIALSDFGDRPPNIVAFINESSSRTAAEFILQLATVECGINNLDVSALAADDFQGIDWLGKRLPSELLGWAMLAHGVTAVERRTKLTFLKKGAGEVITPDFGHFDTRPIGDPSRSALRDSEEYGADEIPRRVEIKFIDKDKDLTTGSVYGPKDGLEDDIANVGLASPGPSRGGPGGDRLVKSYSIPLVMDVFEAAEVAELLVTLLQSERERATISLPWGYANLAETDILDIGFEWQGLEYKLEIESITHTADYRIECVVFVKKAEDA